MKIEFMNFKSFEEVANHSKSSEMITDIILNGIQDGKEHKTRWCHQLREDFIIHYKIYNDKLMVGIK